MKHTDTSITFFRKDYRPPTHLIEQVHLDIALNPARTIVVNRMKMRRNPANTSSTLILDGEEQELIGVRINGEVIKDYTLTEKQLTLNNTPEEFELSITSACAPEKNTSLMGLYVSNGNFFTQCEAEGFRKITYFLDRPDVMATYTVTLRAVKKDVPVLLSNGNLIKEEDVGNGWHMAVWEDPFPKPSYLFALVGGRLQARERRIQSRSPSTTIHQRFRLLVLQKTALSYHSHLCKSLH